jgi:hypothetical protein
MPVLPKPHGLPYETRARARRYQEKRRSVKPLFGDSSK